MNRFNFLHSVLFALVSVPQLSGLDTILVEIRTDDTPLETTWTIKDENGDLLFSDEGKMTEPNFIYVLSLEVEEDVCATFEIFDAGGDGMSGGGYYAVNRNKFWYGAFIRDFGGYNFHIMGDCVEGTACETPMPVSALVMLHPGVQNYWYTITPEEDMFYEIQACFNNQPGEMEQLDTRMYVYEKCPDVLLSTPEGAIAYSDNFCEAGAGFGSLRFEAGKQYFIRVEILEEPSLPAIRITFEPAKENPGCMDPASCNYNPLANVEDGSCVFDQGCGPDLEINSSVFESSIYLDKYILEDTCLLDEKCVTGLGERDIVRFSTAIFNIGNADYVVGFPDRNSDGFSDDNCHDHWHQLGYAEYILYGGAGQPEPIGFKNGFCVLDLECGVSEPKYDCNYMGITAGCKDVYSADIDCQWIDLTDVADGDYTMVARINWARLPDARGLHELDYENNWAQVCINLDRSSGELELTINNTCPEYVDCFGVAFGSAVEDCNGECGGVAHYGDINRDDEITRSDIDTYLAEIGNGVLQSTSCTDLDGNGLLSVYDACLLEECLATYDSTEPWHQHCLFPSGIDNPDSEATLSLMEVDLQENSIVVGCENLQSEIKAFQFRLSGIDEIVRVEDATGTGMRPYWSHGLDVLAISDSILMSGPETPLVKIFFKNQIENEICIAEIIDIVNPSFQKILGKLAPANCFFYSHVVDHGNGNGLFLFPNPVTDKLYIDTKGRTGLTMQLVTISGRVVKELSLEPLHVLNLLGFESGLYIAKFSDGTHRLIHIDVD